MAWGSIILNIIGLWVLVAEVLAIWWLLHRLLSHKESVIVFRTNNFTRQLLSSLFYLVLAEGYSGVVEPSQCIHISEKAKVIAKVWICEIKKASVCSRLFPSLQCNRHLYDMYITSNIYRLRLIVKSGFRFWNSDFTAKKSVLRVDFLIIKKSKSGFHGFPFYRSIGKSEKGFATLFSWTTVFFLLIMHAHARPLFLGTVFQFLFRISQSHGKKEIQKQIFQHWNPLLDFAFDCKSEMRILKSKSRFPNWTHPYWKLWHQILYKLSILSFLCHIIKNKNANHSIQKV